MEESRLVKLLSAQIEYSYRNFTFYRKRIDGAAINPGDIRTLNDFHNLPFMNRSDQARSFEEDPPRGSLYHPKTVGIWHTPSPQFGLLPEYDTERDLQNAAESLANRLRDCGVTEEDVVQITPSYHLVQAGLGFHEAFRRLGSKVINIGPGNTERQIEIMRRLGTSVVVAFPSFALQLAEAGAPPVKALVCCGEPFTSIPGYRERMRAAWRCDMHMLELYGTSGIGQAALECQYERGPHVLDDWVYVEVIDPETGKVLPLGERGELVLTHLNKEAAPLIRFRTGDLSTLESVDCQCGQVLTLTKGVFGRTDEMYRIKGQKFYPSTVPLILAGIPGTSPREFRFVVSRPEGRTDRVKVLVKGDPELVDLHVLRERLVQRLIISPDELEVVSELVAGPQVQDERGSLDR